MEFASVVNSTYSHDSSVTCLSWRDNVLVTGSWDSTVKVSNSTCVATVTDLHLQVWDLTFSEARLGDPLLMVRSAVCIATVNEC